MIDSDQSSIVVNDQFSIGDEIIVAPILELGKRERDVSWFAMLPNLGYFGGVTK